MSKWQLVAKSSTVSMYILYCHVMYWVPCSLQSVVGLLFVIDILSVVSYFNGGLQLLCFCRGSQTSCASCGLVSPKGVWCIWLSDLSSLFCGCPLFGFLLHAQISSYLHCALAFPVNWLIHWVFAYVSMWTGTLFRVPDSLLWMVKVCARSHCILL